MPASRRESENAVGSYDVDVVVVNSAVVVAVSMTSSSSADIFRHLFPPLLLVLPLAREEKNDDDDDDARKREAQKWHSRRRLRVVILFDGATAARADIARMMCVILKMAKIFSLKTLIVVIIKSVSHPVVHVRVVVLVFKIFTC